MNEIAAFRICCVELVGHDRLIPACDNVVAEGMGVSANSHKVREARRSCCCPITMLSCTNCTRKQPFPASSRSPTNMRGTHYPKKLSSSSQAEGAHRAAVRRIA